MVCRFLPYNPRGSCFRLLSIRSKTSKLFNKCCSIVAVFTARWKKRKSPRMCKWSVLCTRKTIQSAYYETKSCHYRHCIRWTVIDLAYKGSLNWIIKQMYRKMHDKIRTRPKTRPLRPKSSNESPAFSSCALKIRINLNSCLTVSFMCTQRIRYREECAICQTL